AAPPPPSLHRTLSLHDARPISLTLTEGGEAQSAAATVEPEDATDKAVTYTSSDESIATVDAAGNVTPVTPGEATITAKLGDLERSEEHTSELQSRFDLVCRLLL